MRKLYHLDESEKERILNMHKDATKKHYLVEGKNYLTESYTTENQLLVELWPKWPKKPKVGPIKDKLNVKLGKNTEALSNAVKKELKAFFSTQNVLDNNDNLYYLGTGEVIPNVPYNKIPQKQRSGLTPNDGAYYPKKTIKLDAINTIIDNLAVGKALDPDELDLIDSLEKGFFIKVNKTEIPKTLEISTITYYISDGGKKISRNFLDILKKVKPKGVRNTKLVRWAARSNWNKFLMSAGVFFGSPVVLSMVTWAAPPIIKGTIDWWSSFLVTTSSGMDNKLKSFCKKVFTDLVDDNNLFEVIIKSAYEDNSVNFQRVVKTNLTNLEKICQISNTTIFSMIGGWDDYEDNSGPVPTNVLRWKNSRILYALIDKFIKKYDYDKNIESIISKFKKNAVKVNYMITFSNNKNSTIKVEMTGENFIRTAGVNGCTQNQIYDFVTAVNRNDFTVLSRAVNTKDGLVFDDRSTIITYNVPNPSDSNPETYCKCIKINTSSKKELDIKIETILEKASNLKEQAYSQDLKEEGKILNELQKLSDELQKLLKT